LEFPDCFGSLAQIFPAGISAACLPGLAWSGRPVPGYFFRDDVLLLSKVYQATVIAKPL
jgi:hypothetical protein